jgi:invasion protein IalB
MTHNMRSSFLVLASTGGAIAGALLSAAVISGGPAAAAEARGRAPSSTAEMPKLIYSPWAKFCGKGTSDPSGREVCFTGKDARTEDGRTFMAATLIEPQGGPKKFRVVVPSSSHPRGPRIIIDKEPAISSTFFSCFANTCTADYEATPELVDKLKNGQMLQIQVGGLAPMIPVLLPLADSSGNSFAGANEGPPTDPKVFQEQQRKKRCPLCQGPFAQKSLLSL